MRGIGTDEVVEGQALASGSVQKTYAAHLTHLLDEAPVPLVVMNVKEVAASEGVAPRLCGATSGRWRVHWACTGRVCGRRCTPAMFERRCTHRCTHRGRSVETLTTRVFNNGNSQAVRIPAEFRLDTDRVSISRNESGDLVIHPLRAERGAALLDALRAVGDADMAYTAALEAEQAGPQPMQEREAL
jgi:antitoxin VapB